MDDQLLPTGPLERDPSAIFRWLLDGVLVLGPRATEPAKITTPGDAVWDAFSEPQTFASITDALARAYAAPGHVVRADIGPVIRLLLESGAIGVSGA